MVAKWIAGVLGLCIPAAAAAPGETQLLSLSHGAPILTGKPNGSSEESVISADGRYVVFASAASNFVSDDTNGRDDVFVYDRVSGTTERVSVSNSGEQGNDTSTWPEISGDGRLVLFWSSATNLVTGDDDGGGNLLLHDRSTGETTLLRIPETGPSAVADRFGIRSLSATTATSRSAAGRGASSTISPPGGTSCIRSRWAPATRTCRKRSTSG